MELLLLLGFLAVVRAEGGEKIRGNWSQAACGLIMLVGCSVVSFLGGVKQYCSEDWLGGCRGLLRV